nr:kalirin-like [Lytechinus pictus]
MSSDDAASSITSGGDSTSSGAIGGAFHCDALKAADILPLLRDKLAFLSGGRDKRGGPILAFPSGSALDKVSPIDLRRLVFYLSGIPSDEARDLGFTVIIDMRGSTWTNIKPVLKALQECVPDNIHMVYIIKPEKFWQKQRTSMGSSKLKFETTMISSENLVKLVDPAQLTVDMEGTMHYDHEEWLQLRLALEDFICKAVDMMQHQEQITLELGCMNFAMDIEGAQSSLQDHEMLRRSIQQMPVEAVNQEGQKVLRRICGVFGGDSVTVDSGYGGSFTSSSTVSLNADFQAVAPRILQLLDNVANTRQHLYQQWTTKQAKLEQCLQLKLFEQDAKKLFDWLEHHIDLFLINHTDLGHSVDMAAELSDEHNHFASQSMNMYVHINRVLSAASQLIDNGHYASEVIRSHMLRIDREWRAFAVALDERSTLLAMSVTFHKKVYEYEHNFHDWSTRCHLDGELPHDVGELESMLQQHHALSDDINQKYTQVLSDGKALLAALQQPLSPESENSVTAQTNYSQSAGHFLDLIHEVLQQHRELDERWQRKRTVINQRVQLCVFQHDTAQVLFWLQNYGEEFLNKHTSIGKSLHKARALQKKHEEFEAIAQVSLDGTVF